MQKWMTVRRWAKVLTGPPSNFVRCFNGLTRLVRVESGGGHPSSFRKSDIQFHLLRRYIFNIYLCPPKSIFQKHSEVPQKVFGCLVFVSSFDGM